MKKKDQHILEKAERENIPVFVISADDAKSVQTLLDYYTNCEGECDLNHLSNILERATEFGKWQAENPDKVKLAD